MRREKAASTRHFLESARVLGGWAKQLSTNGESGAADSTEGMTCNVLLIRMERCWCGVEKCSGYTQEKLGRNSFELLPAFVVDKMIKKIMLKITQKLGRRAKFWERREGGRQEN